MNVIERKDAIEQCGAHSIVERAPGCFIAYLHGSWHIGIFAGQEDARDALEYTTTLPPTYVPRHIREMGLERNTYEDLYKEALKFSSHYSQKVGIGLEPSFGWCLYSDIPHMLSRKTVSYSVVVDSEGPVEGYKREHAINSRRLIT